jgi:hypothetical protein
MLGGTERILPLLRKRLEAAGYDDDELPTIVGEDLGHIFNLIVRDVTWRAEVRFSNDISTLSHVISSRKSPPML